MGQITWSYELPMFSRGIDFLPAGAEIPVWWGSFELIVGDFYEQKMDRRGIGVEISYESDNRQRYFDEYRLNPVDMWHEALSRPPNLNRIVNPITKIAGKIDKAIDANGYVKLKTASERKRESNDSLGATMRQMKVASERAKKRRQEQDKQVPQDQEIEGE
jgi:hypothetical protein